MNVLNISGKRTYIHVRSACTLAPVPQVGPQPSHTPTYFPPSILQGEEPTFMWGVPVLWLQYHRWDPVTHTPWPTFRFFTAWESDEENQPGYQGHLHRYRQKETGIYHNSWLFALYFKTIDKHVTTAWVNVGKSGCRLYLRKQQYCNHGNFCVDVISSFFAILPSFRKFHPRENKTHMTLLKK